MEITTTDNSAVIVPIAQNKPIIPGATASTSADGPDSKPRLAWAPPQIKSAKTAIFVAVIAYFAWKKLLKGKI